MNSGEYLSIAAELRSIRKELAGIGGILARGPLAPLSELGAQREAHDDLEELRTSSQAVLDAWDRYGSGFLHVKAMETLRYALKALDKR